jgi:hypothetical protein
LIFKNCAAGLFRSRSLTPFTTIEDLLRETGPFPANSAKQATLTIRCMVGSARSGRRPTTRAVNSRHVQAMSDEPKSPAELKEIRLNRKLAQDAEGIKAMADIAAADIAIRKRTADLRALRLAKEAADRDKPPVPKAKPRKKKAT